MDMQLVGHNTPKCGVVYSHLKFAYLCLCKWASSGEGGSGLSPIRLHFGGLPKLGVPFGDPHAKDYIGVYIGIPLFWETTT